MSPRSSPTVWRRWLAHELRRLREDRGLAQKDAGKACGWSGARLSYIENAQQSVRRSDLDKLLPLYGVPEDRWDEFVDAAARSRQQGVWERYDQRVVPRWLSRYVELEQGAASVCCADPVVVPGLFQTYDYAATIIAGDVIPRTDHQVRQIVSMRLARQDVVTREDAPLEVSAVIDESVLRRVGGGPAVMATQIDHLATMAERPNITLRVLPLSAGVNAGMFGAYRILSFPWASDPGIGYVEYRNGAVYIEDALEVDSLRLAFEHLAALARTPTQSLAMLRATAEEYAHRV